MKLKPEHVTPYLPYDLKFRQRVRKAKNDFYYKKRLMTIGNIEWLLTSTIQMPILKPLPDYKDVNSKAMNELNCDLQDQMTISQLANGYISIDQVNYDVIKIMAKNHIDFNRLIPEGLAVDKNTLK